MRKMSGMLLFTHFVDMRKNWSDAHIRIERLKHKPSQPVISECCMHLSHGVLCCVYVWAHVCVHVRACICVCVCVCVCVGKHESEST